MTSAARVQSREGDAVCAGRNPAGMRRPSWSDSSRWPCASREILSRVARNHATPQRLPSSGRDSGRTRSGHDRRACTRQAGTTLRRGARLTFVDAVGRLTRPRSSINKNNEQEQCNPNEIGPQCGHRGSQSYLPGTGANQIRTDWPPVESPEGLAVFTNNENARTTTKIAPQCEHQGGPELYLRTNSARGDRRLTLSASTRGSELYLENKQFVGD